MIGSELFRPAAARTPRPAQPFALDSIFVGCTAILLCWGLIMVASSSVAQAQYLDGGPFYYFWRQLGFVVVGVLVAAVAFRVPMAWWEKHSGWLALGALLLLIAVLVPGIGVRINAAQRWVNLKILSVQVSEPARLALFIYLAGYIVRRQVRLQNEWTGLLIPFLPLLLAGGLLMLEPDFGATAILFGVAFLMLFLGGARWWHLGILITLACSAMALLAVAAPYRVRRLTSFTDPFSVMEGSGWQLSNALIAVGRGQVTGVGLGNSIQKLLYLPQMNTDFIFAILAEEFGLIGITILISLFLIVVWRGFVIGAAAEAVGERFKAYLCYGLSSWLGFQAMINMAVNLGMLPTKGLTLPLISYGGSSLISVLIMLALILRVDHENRAAQQLRSRLGVEGAA